MSDAWMNEYLTVSHRLKMVLGIASRGGSAQRFLVLDEIAEQLGIDPGALHSAGFDVLAAMVPALEQALEDGPGHWTSDLAEERHISIARQAAAAVQPSEAVAALCEFGWGGDRIDRTTVDDLTDALRAKLTQRLGPRVFKLLERWRRCDVWAPERELGIVTKRARSA